MLKQLAPALKMMVLFTMLTGFVYPGVVTALSQVLFKHQADGSLIMRNGQIVGSALLGQSFTRPEYFHPRPSAASYDASASNGSQFGPTSQKLTDRMRDGAVQFRKDNPDFSGPIPADAITTSGSGLDPEISPANAAAQAPRVAAARHLSRDVVERLIAANTRQRSFGLFGEPRVNVLELNLALDHK